MPSTAPPWTLGSGPLAKLASGTNTTYDVARVGAGLGRGPSLRKKSNAAAWSNTFPAPQATLDLDFANDRGFVRGVGQGKSMDAVTFTRASNATFVGQDGLLQTASFGYGTGVPQAYQVTTAASVSPNDLTYSQNFTNAAWTLSNATIGATNITAPDSTNTASSLIEGSGTVSPILYVLSSNLTSVKISSIYIKAIPGSAQRYVFIGVSTIATRFAYFLFDPVTGTLAAPYQFNDSIQNFAYLPQVFDAGNGWYRISCQVASPVTGNRFIVGLTNTVTPTNNYTLGSYTGDGSSGVYIWGAQYEVSQVQTISYTPRFDWASTAQAANKNLLTNTETFVTGWSGTLAISGAFTNPIGGSNAVKAVPPSGQTFTNRLFSTSGITNVGTTYIFSCYAKAAEWNYLTLYLDNSTAYFNLSTGAVGTVSGVTASISDAGNGWYRCSVSKSYAASNASVRIFASNQDNGSTSGDGTSGIYIWGAQLELGSSVTAYQAIGAQTPSSTPLAANPTCNGLLIEESRANRLLWCRDASNAAWTKTNVTAAKDQTGIDGVANAASSLTASADAGTCIQTITLASGSRTGSVYLKRLTGTGNVQVTLDGSTWSTVDLSSTEWRRIVLSGTVTNPTVGIRLATNGDAVAMDYGQIEDGAFATSPILTTTASVTRSADVPTVRSDLVLGLLNQAEGTLYAEQPAQPRRTNGRLASIYTSGNVRLIELYNASATNVGATVVTTALGINGSENVSVKSALGGKYGYLHLVNNFSGTVLQTSSTAPSPTRTDYTIFGIGVYAGNQLNGCVKRIFYIPKALPADILIAMVIN